MENKLSNRKSVLTDRAFVLIINVILQKVMKEKQITGPFRELPGGARQQGCKAFRSGAANDEFDGYARYSGGKRDVIDKYDNAVRYNDYVLQQLYETLKENPRFKGFVYFSDHGEDVEHNYGHEASKFTATMSHIPLFMVISPAFQAERPQTVEILRSHRDSYWTNDLIYNAMIDLLGISGVPGSDLDWDLASSQYNMTKETLRTLHGKQTIQ